MEYLTKEELRQKTISLIQKVFKSGYVPSRCKESYNYITKSGLPAYRLANCFSHACFNLTNKQLEELEFNDDMRRSLNCFDFTPVESNEFIEEKLIQTVKDVGLNITKESPDAVLKNNQWLVALYFSKNSFFKDYHILLKEKDNSWTSKEGPTNYFFTLDNLPEKYHTGWIKYNLYQTYKIENPFAKEGDR